jgi:hypothetical protein
MQLERFRESFAGTYLTLISILQGVLLGVMATTVEARFDDLSAIHWLRIATSVMMVVAVWNEYRMGTTQFMWISNIFDTLIPFTIGAVQLAILWASFGSSARWFWMLSGLYFLGIVGYENLYRQAAADSEVNGEALRATGRWRVWNPRISGLCGCVCVVSGTVLWYTRGTQWIELTVTAMALVLAVGFLLRGEANWRQVVGYLRTRGSDHQVIHDVEGASI